MTGVLAGLSKVCKTFREGFDSLPRLYTNRSLGKAIFGPRVEEWRKEIKERAYNPVYRVPIYNLTLARDIILFLEGERRVFKEGMVAARREVSKLRRGQ